MLRSIFVSLHNIFFKEQLNINEKPEKPENETENYIIIDCEGKQIECQVKTIECEKKPIECEVKPIEEKQIETVQELNANLLDFNNKITVENKRKNDSKNKKNKNKKNKNKK